MLISAGIPAVPRERAGYGYNPMVRVQRVYCTRTTGSNPYPARARKMSTRPVGYGPGIRMTLEFLTKSFHLECLVQCAFCYCRRIGQAIIFSSYRTFLSFFLYRTQ